MDRIAPAPKQAPKYFLCKDNQNEGSYSKEELRLMRQTGAISDDVPVWNEGFSDWAYLKNLLEVNRPKGEATPKKKKLGALLRWGIAILLLGFVIVWNGLFFNTTVTNGAGTWNNIGLEHDQLIIIILGCVVSLSGVITAVAGAMKGN